MTIRYGGVIAGQEEIDAVTEVLKGQVWSAGEVTKRFETRFASYVGTDYGIAVNSGSSALLLALAVLPRYSKVIVPALQFPTLYSAADWCRHHTIIMDIDPKTLNLNANLLREWLEAGNRADAVAFVHVAGNPAGIQEVYELCNQYGMFLIEDCCEAMGSQSDANMVGNFGDISCFSTHSAHHISTGEGGMVLTSDPEYAHQVRELRDWGRDITKGYDGYNFKELGFNLRQTDIASALGLVQFTRLRGFHHSRRANYYYLARHFRTMGCAVPEAAPNDLPSWYTCPVLTPKRDELEVALRNAGVETRRLLCGNLVRMPIAAHKDAPAVYPGAEKAWSEGLWVPVHPSLTIDDLNVIVGAAEKVLG